MRIGKRPGVVLLAAAVLIGLLVFFFPKERVVGGLRGGPIGPGESAYRADYACIGIPYDFCPNWPDYGCDAMCYGWVTSPNCAIERYDGVEGLSRASTACRQDMSPRWGFPGW